MTAYEYIINLKDRATSTLRSVARTAGVADSKIRGVSSATTQADSSSSKWAGTLSSLKGMIVGVGVAMTLWAGMFQSYLYHGLHLKWFFSFGV